MQVTTAPAADSRVQLAGTAQSLRGIAPGQKIEAVVTQSAPAGQLVTLQLADRQIQIRAEIPLVQGQTLLLERLPATEAAPLRLLTISNLPPPADTLLPLKPGSQVAVEVIKLLAQQRLLVNINPVLPGLPAQLEIDISQLNQAQRNIRSGDNLLLEVLRLQPLSIAIKTAPQININELQRQLLPQLVTPPAKLSGLLGTVNDSKLQQQILPAITQLLQAVPQPQALQNAGQLQQVIRQSGVFLEQQLARQAPVSQDFKANLLTLAAALKTALQSTDITAGKISQLPAEVRQQLLQILSQPQHLQQLPAQIPNLLSSAGKTPTQLILQLLTGQTTLPPLQSAQTLPPMTAAIPNQPIPAQFAELARLQLLLREVEGTLARVQLNQLSMLREPDANSPTTQVWLTDVPVRDKQQLQWLQLQIERRKNAGGDVEQGDDHWQVTLNLETLTLGQLQAAISLQNRQVQVILTAQSAATLNLLEQDLDWLQEKLAALDLTVGQCRCRLGKVDWLTPVDVAKRSEALLDISV